MSQSIGIGNNKDKGEIKRRSWDTISKGNKIQPGFKYTRLN